MSIVLGLCPLSLFHGGGVDILPKHNGKIVYMYYIRT